MSHVYNPETECNDTKVVGVFKERVHFKDNIRKAIEETLGITFELQACEYTND
jgi:hypothetical protein